MFVQRSGSVREKIHIFMLLLIRSYKIGSFLLRWSFFLRKVGREKTTDIKPPKLLSTYSQSYIPKDLNAISTLHILSEEEAGGKSSQLNERVTLLLQAA